MSIVGDAIKTYTRSRLAYKPLTSSRIFQGTSILMHCTNKNWNCAQQIKRQKSLETPSREFIDNISLFKACLSLTKHTYLQTFSIIRPSRPPHLKKHHFWAICVGTENKGQNSGNPEFAWDLAPLGDIYTSWTSLEKFHK